jgi:hypothetical protein
MRSPTFAAVSSPIRSHSMHRKPQKITRPSLSLMHASDESQSPGIQLSSVSAVPSQSQVSSCRRDEDG